MKVVLDLSKLLDEKKITQSEYDKLNQFAMQETASLGFNLLVGFGVIAVSIASIALVPSVFTTILIGALVSIIGLSLLRRSSKWGLCAQICILVGSLLLSGGILWLDAGSTRSWIIVTLLLAAGSISIRSGLLIVLSVLALSVTIGNSTAYDHATYMIMAEQPGVTVLVFSFLALVTYQLSCHLPLLYQPLAILASRTSIFLVNFGFWIGSLWGDNIAGHLAVSDMTFVITWALALIIVAVWSVKTNRRWVMNVCAVFGAIHFYTQWFERLGATPATVLCAGIIALVLAVGIRRVNASFNGPTRIGS